MSKISRNFAVSDSCNSSIYTNNLGLTLQRRLSLGAISATKICVTE